MSRISTCLLALAFLGGCSTGGVGLRSASDRLDDTSRSFYQQLASERAPKHTVDDAAVLADVASDFHREVRDGESRETLAPMFDRVAERYHHLRNQLDTRTTTDRYYRSDFGRVTEAYLDVERAMEYPRDSRYHN